MLLSLQELIVWTGLGPFEVALHSIGLLIFTCLLTLQLETVIDTSWHAVFSPLYVALGLHVYYLVVVSARMATWCVQRARKSTAAVVIITSASFFGAGLLFYVEYAIASYLDGTIEQQHLQASLTTFIAYLFIRLIVVYRALMRPIPLHEL